MPLEGLCNIAIHESKPDTSSGNAQIGAKSAFFSPVTLKIDGWPWKTIGILSKASRSYVQRFVAVHEFKLELSCGKGKIDLTPLTLTFCMDITLD